MHECLFISEILCIILEFTQQYDESPSTSGCEEDRKLRKQTLAFSSPALDQLWMRLDSLDPLIRILPSCASIDGAAFRIGTLPRSTSATHQSGRMWTGVVFEIGDATVGDDSVRGGVSRGGAMEDGTAHTGGRRRTWLERGQLN